jgi:serine/threonine protein kinase
MKEIGNYIISQKIGSGSSSSVYMAKNIQTHQKCCVKLIPKLNIQNSKDKEHLLTEIRIFQSIRHPNLVHFIEFIETAQYYCFFMELIEGKPLSLFINSNHVLTENQAHQIFVQLISVISFLHQKEIYHRDIKPENILVQSNLKIKLIDFGLSSSNPNLLSTYCGSFRYSAPECILCQPYKGSSADMWSLGVVLFAMITGKLPWMNSNLKRVTEEIINTKYDIPKETPVLCADLISHLLQKDPSQRLTAEEVKQHQWIVNSFEKRKNMTPSRRNSNFEKLIQPKIVKWISSSTSNKSDGHSNHYPFNLKFPEIVPNDFVIPI